MVLAQADASPAPPASFRQALTAQQLTEINVYLDQLLLALVALTDLDDQTWQWALAKIAPRQTASDWLATPHPQQSTAPKPVDVNTIRALTMAIACLSQHYQELLRRSVSLMEQTTEQGKNPLQTALIGQYSQKLADLWDSYCDLKQREGESLPEARRLELLTELFFYSSQDGPRRLWRVLENVVL